MSSLATGGNWRTFDGGADRSGTWESSGAACSAAVGQSIHVAEWHPLSPSGFVEADRDHNQTENRPAPPNCCCHRNHLWSRTGTPPCGALGKPFEICRWRTTATTGLVPARLYLCAGFDRSSAFCRFVFVRYRMFFAKASDSAMPASHSRFAAGQQQRPCSAVRRCRLLWRTRVRCRARL